MLTIGEKFPAFSLTATVGIESDIRTAFRTITDLDYPGKWKVYFFWPNDFTLVCPTELIGFAKLDKDFRDRDTQIIGGSIDSEWAHHAWRNHHSGLKNLPFPMLADVKRDLTEQLGILDPRSGVAHRATFIVDPDNIIQFVYVTTGPVGRNPDEVMRVLDALQSKELCPCNWHKGEESLLTK